MIKKESCIIMKRIPLLLLIFLFSFCTPHKVNRNLADIESYISERPDSALAVLESIDRTELKTNKSRAHHALLHAMALDKNYIDISDDSLASIAVNYYQKFGPKKYLARSLYYLGLSYFYDKQYSRAIIELSKAEQIAQSHDSLYLGFIKMLQAETYCVNYNGVEEMSSVEAALSIYSDLNNTHYIDIAKHRLVQAYLNNKKYDEAEMLIIELLDSDRLNKRMTAQLMGDYAFLMGTRNNADYEKAVTYYEQTAGVDNGKYLSKQDYWVWAHALAETGNFSMSQQIIDMLSTIDTSGTAYYWQYEIARIKGETEKAFDLLRKFSNKNNEEVVETLRQSISVAHRDHYQSQYMIADYIIRSRNTALIFVIVLATLTFIIICLSAIQYRHKKEAEKEAYIRYAEEASRQLKDFQNNTYSSLQKKYMAMYKTKYEAVASLFEQYIQSEGRKNAENLIYAQVTSLIDNLRNDIGSYEEIERTLDNDLNGIISNLKKEMPDLKEKDYILFGHLALGFDATLISHFMGGSVNSIYIRKSRLKKLIEESSPLHKDEFLQIIS